MSKEATDHLDCGSKCKIEPNGLPNGTPCHKCGGTNTKKEIYTKVGNHLRIDDKAIN